jgi:hypothetical protein
MLCLLLWNLVGEVSISDSRVPGQVNRKNQKAKSPVPVHRIR